MGCSALGRLHQNIWFSVPECCYRNAKLYDFSNELYAAFKTFKTSKAAQAVLHDIASSDKKVLITTHKPETKCPPYVIQPCATWDTPDSHVDSQKPCDAVIYLDPSFKHYKKYYFTKFHHESGHGKSKAPCLKSTKCIRKATPGQIIFHELVHARNMLLGKDQSHDTCVSPEFTNKEEETTIAEENKFLAERCPHDDAKVVQRHGHVTSKDKPRKLTTVGIFSPLKAITGRTAEVADGILSILSPRPTLLTLSSAEKPSPTPTLTQRVSGAAEVAFGGYSKGGWEGMRKLSD